jgi:hypothetical protein
VGTLFEIFLIIPLSIFWIPGEFCVHPVINISGGKNHNDAR